MYAWGPYTMNCLMMLFQKELEATINEDETLKHLKRSDRIKEKEEKDMVFDILNKE